jgi:hypothetical protein
MIDVEKVIRDLKNFSHSMGYVPTHIRDAIKIIKMWQAITRDSCEFELIKCIEEEFFPTYIHKSIVVKVKIRAQEGLARITQIKNCVETYVEKNFNDIEEVEIGD